MKKIVANNPGLSKLLSRWAQALLGEEFVDSITDIWVNPNPSPDNLVHVMIRSENQTIDEYEAYAVRGMSLNEYLANEEEIKNASLASNGRFAFPDSGLDENLPAYLFSSYAQKVAHHIEVHQEETHKSKYRSFSQNGGEARKQAIRSHYDELKPILDGILSQDPDINDYRVAKKLNELGYTTVNGKIWHNTSVQSMREYLQGDPAYAQKGKAR